MQTYKVHKDITPLFYVSNLIVSFSLPKDLGGGLFVGIFKIGKSRIFLLDMVSLDKWR